ncbi:MAG: serine O-acetyltransferase EpsC [Myxococcaceae bacterium]
MRTRDELIEALMSAVPSPEAGQATGFPSRHEVLEVVDTLRGLFFPGYGGPLGSTRDQRHVAAATALAQVAAALSEQVRRALLADGNVRGADAPHVVEAFLARLPQIQALLQSDVDAALEGDPAAGSRDEVVLSYPGLCAMTHQRVAHVLWGLGLPLIPRMMTEIAHAQTGIDIHPGAEIGPRFFIDHGTGVVVGETAVIGSAVRIYQGVTLGAKRIAVGVHGGPARGAPRHPIVEDGVVIYANATLLGRIRVGRGSIIGGNVWLDHDVPPHSVVTQAQSRQERFDDGGGI